MSGADSSSGTVSINQQNWSKKQEQLVKRWSERAAGYRWLHNHARLYFSSRNDWLAYPSIVISSITGVGGFAVLQPDGTEDLASQTKTFVIALQYVFAFLNVIGGILSSISKFSQFSNLAVEHSAMCVQWSKLYRSIDMELSLDIKDRADAVDFVKRVREEYDRMLSEAPDIPSNSIEAFQLAFPNRANRPDVCNGLSIIDNDAQNSASSRIRSKWFETFRSIRSQKKEKNSSQV